jgi:quercetin dioxygenase-like cupin family protein
MDDFSWSDYWGPEMDSTIDLQKQFLDIAVARPLGVLVSEATKPAERLSREQAGGHFGISQTVWVSPQTNSRDTIIALVEYEPGGHTGMHAHTDMEQSFYVLSGRALFQIGEMEKEVGPGDLIFFPLNVKHSYQVLGDVPFKFLHLEWRDVR